MKKRLIFMVGWIALIQTGYASANDVPQWWLDRGVFDTNHPAHDFYPVNQGQVKWMCTQAYTEFQEKLPGKQNTNILEQIDAFPPGNNFRPSSMGMLKNSALLFYERLIEEGYAVDLPWSGKTAKNYALANRGQMKNLFRFDLDAFDSDGDGLPNWWEQKYGLSNAEEDPDHDGLNNLREYQVGSNPFEETSLVPSDENMPVGDGSVNPSQGAFTDVLEVDGSAVSDFLGTWVLDGSAIYAAGRRGSLTYTVDFPQADIFRLSLEVAQQTVESVDFKNYRLRVAVDGEFVARRTMVLSGDEVQATAIDTPFLSVGEHSIEVYWDNYENDLALRVEQLRFQQYPGMDSNENGIKDWIENRLMARNTIDVAPKESRTSPVCLEGRGLFTDAMQVDGADTVFHGTDDRWFANADLPSDGATTNLAVQFENGGRILTRPVRWKKTNLLTDALANEVLRRGDALRLMAALPEMVSGSAEITLNGQSLGTCTIDDALVYRFEEDGSYILEATASGLDQQGNLLSYARSVDLEVVSTHPEIIAAQIWEWRPWNRPNHWPEQAVVEWDSRILWREIPGESELQTTIVPEQRYGVVRLDEKGPILAPITVKGFNLWFMRHTYLHYDEIYEDGSFRAETSMIMSPLLPEIRINQRSRGAIFYDNGSRVRDFSVADFNSWGELSILFFHPSGLAHSVCHYTDIYQDDILIGRTY